MQIVEQNSREHARDGVTFQQIDLLNDPLPCADLIFCRDCLVHFSFKDITRALTNVRGSGAGWLMMTQFSETRTNVDIATNQWWPLNFLQPPFNFPAPRAIFQEISETAFHELEQRWRSANPERAEWLAKWRDKSIAVWAVADLA